MRSDQCFSKGRLGAALLLSLAATLCAWLLGPPVPEAASSEPRLCVQNEETILQLHRDVDAVNAQLSTISDQLKTEH